MTGAIGVPGPPGSQGEKVRPGFDLHTSVITLIFSNLVYRHGVSELRLQM